MNKINVGLIGLGNVGSELFKMIQKESERFRVLKIAVRDKNKERKVDVDKNLLTENASEIIRHPDISVVIDASNDAPENIFERIAHKKEWVPKAVLKPYILASKKTMAFYGEEILRFSRENGIEIGFEATVCAGIPIVRLLREGHIPEKITEVGGILNGTTNYILTRMHQGKAVYYEDALLEAQKLGYAEADPTEDVSGLDSAYKLVILAGLCFRRWPKIDDVKIRGIDKLNQRDFTGMTEVKYKLVASGDCLKLRIAPRICGENNELERKLKNTNGVENLIYIKTEHRPLFFSGPGAGGKVTAAAMMSDLNFIASQMGIE